jgi:prepilin-type processing-associated H-X9-DG protein
LSLKMYSGESRGEKYPPRETYAYAETAPGSGIFAKNGSLSRDMIFDGYSMYPEYLSDWNALWCPSWHEPSAMDRYDAAEGNGDGIIQPHEITKEPFDYTGWVIMDDKNILGALVGTIGTGPNGRFEEADYVGTTPFGELWDNNVNGNPPGAASDDDFTTVLYAGMDYMPGGGDTMFRLREGVERFLITDINNPGANAQAQSTVPIMWDHISTNAVDFAHVPGGANILYLDGHVQYIRYPGTKFPMTEDSARIFGRYNRGFDGF